MRYSLQDKPTSGTLVEIVPIKLLTTSIAMLDTKHCYSQNNTKGIVISDKEYIKTYRTYERLVKLKYLIPIKLETGDVLLVPPSFLVSKTVNLSGGNKRRKDINIKEKILNRIKELKMFRKGKEKYNERSSEESKTQESSCC